MKLFPIILGCVFGITASYSFIQASWTAPTSTPPFGNAQGPLTIGPTVEGKSGPLVVTTLGASTEMRSDLYCDALGGNCLNRALGGGGGITQLQAGYGITLSPSTITSSGTIAANLGVLQRRVSGSCPAGQAVRAVNADGTVVCQTIATGGSNCFYKDVAYAPGYSCFVMAYSSPACSLGGTNHAYMRCGTNGQWAYTTFTCTRSSPTPPSCP